LAWCADLGFDLITTVTRSDDRAGDARIADARRPS
jgi:hypothetical protein